VLAGTPAEAAGVRVGDLIVRLGDEEIAGTADLRRALAGKTGERFELEVIRDGRPVRLEVTIPDPEEDAPTGPRAELRAPLPVPPVAPMPAPVPLAAPAPLAVPAPPAPPLAASRSVV
jgi:membrane-associated protease RseP (regulator of RpoE activity)